MKRGTSHGIDISKWQPPSRFDWAEVKKIQQFGFARACYGVKSDPTFESHFSSMREAGLQAGAYIFYRQTQGWKEQYEAFVGELDRVGFGEGDILPVVDLEWNDKYDGPVKSEVFNNDARALVEALEQKYGGCILYLSPGFYQELKKPEWMLDYPWWIAHYGVEEPLCPFNEYILWQYSGTGKIGGYSGETIDVNWAYGDLPLVHNAIHEPDHEIPNIGDHPVVIDLTSFPDEAPTKPEAGHTLPPEGKIVIKDLPDVPDRAVPEEPRLSPLARIWQVLRALVARLFKQS